MKTVLPSKIGLGTDRHDGKIELPDELFITSEVTSKFICEERPYP